MSNEENPENGGSKKPKYKPWPMVEGPGRKRVDRDRLKEEYLQNPFYSWLDFCAQAGYNGPGSNNNATFPLRKWKQEWVNRQVEVQNESILPQAISVRAAVIKDRLNFCQQWGDTTKNLKNVLDAALRFHAIDAQHDLKLISEGILDADRMRFKAKGTELNAIVHAYRNLQQIQMTSLLVPGTEQQETMIPVREKPLEEQDAENDGEELRNMPVQIMGHENVPAEKLTEIMAKWYDQLADQVPGADSEGVQPSTVASVGDIQPV